MSYEARIVPDAETSKELLRIEESLKEPQDFAFLKELHSEPDRPREGMLVEADGSDWDPGYGAGLYRYDGSNWVFQIALTSDGALPLPELTSAPSSPANGTIAIADGTTWNPGAGAGAYVYHTSAWNHMG